MKDYRNEMIRMIEGMQNGYILRKLYRLVRMMYHADRAEVQK